MLSHVGSQIVDLSKQVLLARVRCHAELSALTLLRQTLRNTTHKS